MLDFIKDWNKFWKLKTGPNIGLGERALMIIAGHPVIIVVIPVVVVKKTAAHIPFWERV